MRDEAEIDDVVVDDRDDRIEAVVVIDGCLVLEPAADGVERMDPRGDRLTEEDDDCERDCATDAVTLTDSVCDELGRVVSDPRLLTNEVGETRGVWVGYKEVRGVMDGREDILRGRVGTGVRDGRIPAAPNCRR
jgi:hypothetical protein